MKIWHPTLLVLAMVALAPTVQAGDKEKAPAPAEPKRAEVYSLKATCTEVVDAIVKKDANLKSPWILPFDEAAQFATKIKDRGQASYMKMVEGFFESAENSLKKEKQDFQWLCSMEDVFFLPHETSKKRARDTVLAMARVVPSSNPQDYAGMRMCFVQSHRGWKFIPFCQ